MSRLLRLSPDQLAILPILITSSLWALSLFCSSTTASLATTLALASSALAYLYHSHSQERSRRDGSRVVVSPRFIQPSAPGQVVLLSGLPTPQPKTILRPFLFSSNTSDDTAPSEDSQQTQMPLPLKQQQQYFHHHQQGQQQLEQHDLKLSDDTTTVDPALRKRSPSTTATNAPLKWNSPLEVIAADALEALENKNDPRIWDYIVVGEGREALDCACDLAELHPSNRILVVLEHPIQSKVPQRVVQRIRRILVAQAQRLWAHEANGALSKAGQGLTLDSHDHRLHSMAQSSDIDYSILPSNVGICSGYCATAILIDKPRQEVPATSPATKPLKRFNSVGGGQRNTLTVNTAVPTPSRTVGLSLCELLDSQSTSNCRVLCRSGVVFANEKHPLIQSLDAITTPPTSKDESGGSSSSDRTDDPSQRACMVFSIKMQYARAKTTMFRSRTWNALAAFLNRSYTLFGDIAPSASDRSAHNSNPAAQIRLRPVLLRRAYPIHQQGRVSLKETKQGEESFRLDIYASTKSLDASCPIQIQVNVVTSPVRPVAFGNTELIRKGEDVLLEGLALARAMARKANWTCLEEDDCQMIEWVRDEMSIRWSSEHVPGQDWWQSVCSGVQGIQRPKRSRISSNGSVRVKTPTLSPYASRTNSYHGQKRESQLIGHRRISTLDKLKEASETLLEQDARLGQTDDYISAKDAQQPTTPKQSKVSIAAAEPVSPQRSSAKTIKTSFGGFSSLNESRSHSLALAEETEDHLGVALSIPSAGGMSSPKDRHDQNQNGFKAFSEGISTTDILGADVGLAPIRPSPPEPKKLSRFSIKSYQLERNKTGLSDNWGLGSLDGTLNPLPSGKSDPLTTPPLVADSTPLGSISPLSPVPVQSNAQVQDFLAGSSSLGDGLTTSASKTDGTRPQQFGKSLFGTAASDLQYRTVTESSNGVDNSVSNSRRSFGVYSPRKSFSSSNAIAPAIANRNISPLDDPVELIPDFLGANLTGTKSFSTTSAAAAPATGAALNRALSGQSTGAIKAVHFEDSRTEDQSRRVESDSCPTSLPMTGEKLSPGEDNSEKLATEDAGARRSSLTSSRSSSTSSSSSKSKAHTRRSWGQGIGGNDIQGIQGLE
ncbi:hypothetical protein EMPS_04501 [Entomortierella parvispora]|uniref:FAD/NAD(P)-binding domain-containing protein n=1 Tax=Entomortierella parvispora TaxID=205924 RepID=A0A9P3LVM4_9FUNG|nr:hypothetical protein EMPS_04501 [Entomortierella parvispora]